MADPNFTPDGRRKFSQRIMTYYCPDCGRYLILRGRTYYCFFCRGRSDLDPDVIGVWDRDVIEQRVVPEEQEA